MIQQGEHVNVQSFDALASGSDNHLEPTDLIVSTKELSLGFGQKTVIADIDLSFPRGSITALIGPSGSGKTTFLRTLNRMNDNVKGFRRTGDVLFNSESIWSPNIDLLVLRRRVGMLFQRANPFPMSIEQNVIAGVKAHNIAKKSQLKQVAKMRLEEVGLWQAVETRLHDSPFRLSGGQQQLLCLARALAIGPDVLLLDEPTSALDPTSIEAVENLILRAANIRKIDTFRNAQAQKQKALTPKRRRTALNIYAYNPKRSDPRKTSLQQAPVTQKLII